ncbi:MAG: hypothetical protein IPQ07_09125 [Myxococcales bacterium]|nr:hypothetical protein [Myxococcales bacterium]
MPLTALDDDREAVRRHVYLWWMLAWDVPTTIGKKVAAKLQALIAKESDEKLRTSAEHALENVREKLGQ